MPVDPQTVQELAQQRAAPMRMDESRPKQAPAVRDPDSPYGALINQEQQYLSDPRSSPGVQGFERELQTQSNQSAEKLRGRIAGVSDPLAVGREMARLDQSTRNQLAVYLSQQQSQARQNLMQLTDRGAQWSWDKNAAVQGAYQQQQQMDLAREKFAAEQQQQARQQNRSDVMKWLDFGLDVAKFASPFFTGGAGAVAAGSLKSILNKGGAGTAGKAGGIYG